MSKLRELVTNINLFFRIFRLSSVTSLILLIPVGAWAKKTPQTDIRVSLLGQSCLLQGPFDETTLKTVHSIGPAQIYPNITSPPSPSALSQVRKALAQIQKVESLPARLDSYREKLGKWFESQIGFLTELETAKKSHHYESLGTVAKKYLKSKDLGLFQSLLKKIQDSKTSPSQNGELLDQLFETYNKSNDPEDEFHRAIEDLNIQYKCVFEEEAEE